LEKLASSQGNKKDMIKGRRKRKMSKFPTLQGRATQTPTNIENLEQDVNVELFKFQDSLNYVTHKEDSPEAFRSRKGLVIEPSSYTQRRKRLVQKFLETSKGRSNLPPP
jgi:hypothetical protein